MKFICRHEHCFPDVPCALGHADRSNCDHWAENNHPENLLVSTESPRQGDVPWNGFALGTSDMAILCGRGRPFLIGTVGPPNAGKTSLLAFTYMWLLKHGRVGNWNFAGSWTLGAWETLLQQSRWSGKPPPTFPAHTSSAGRSPGLLHVAFRHKTSGQLQDLLLADAPGEWFTQWSRAPNTEPSSGARWIVEHSDTIILMLDSAALADPANLPSARRDSYDLLERLAADRASRPLIVAWSKHDVRVPESTRNDLEAAIYAYAPGAVSLATTVESPETIVDCVLESIRLSASQTTSAKIVEPVQSNEPFFAFRGHRDEH